MSGPFEANIEPLVNVLNLLDFIKTIYSCEGHFDRPPNKKFLPTAYVTFSTTDLPRFKRLYDQICELNESLTSRGILGCALMLAGMLTSQLMKMPEARTGEAGR